MAKLNRTKLEKLMGVSTAIKDGDITIEAAFPIEAQDENQDTGSKVEKVAKKIKANTEKMAKDLFDVKEPA